MRHKSQRKRVVRKFHPQILLLSLFFVIVLIFFIVSLITTSQQHVPAPIQAQPPTSTPTPSMTYTSDKLGIRFSYITAVSGVVYMYTREIGNKIYLYYTPGADQPFEGTDNEFILERGRSGYSVEVFYKDPSQSLENAVKEQFLSGYSEHDCFVRSGRYGDPRKDQSYKTVIIDYNRPVRPKTREEDLEAAAKCPEQVSALGLRYFMMDPKHPEKLLFVDIGQDNILSGIKGLPWDGTIEVLR